MFGLSPIYAKKTQVFDISQKTDDSEERKNIQVIKVSPQEVATYFQYEFTSSRKLQANRSKLLKQTVEYKMAFNSIY